MIDTYGLQYSFILLRQRPKGALFRFACPAALYAGVANRGRWAQRAKHARCPANAKRRRALLGAERAEGTPPLTMQEIRIAALM